MRFILFSLLASLAAASPSGGEVVRKIEGGKPVSATIDWPDADPQLFRIRVPPEAHLVRIALDGAAADLDVYAACSRSGAVPATLDDYPYADLGNGGRARLVISRDADPPLEDGACVIAVVPGDGPAPVAMRGGEHRLKVRYGLAVSTIALSLDGDLALAAPRAAALDLEQGYVRTYRFQPPANGAVRIDLESEADADLYAAAGAPPRSAYAAQFGSHSPLSRESLLLSAQDVRSLRGQPLFIRVYLPGGGDGEDFQVPFALYATAGDAPPAALAALPAAPRPVGPLGEAQRTTVEVCRGDLCGSGVLVSAAGHVLTAQHVLSGDREAQPGDLASVGWTLDPGKPPVPLFRAEVLVADAGRDVALLQIRSGFYGQPLPPGYKLPAAPRGELKSLGLGAPLVVAGYPITGGAGSLPTLTVSRGVVAGFQRRSGGTLIKTDAVVHEGNSGGPAFDGQWNVVGLAVFKVGESEGTGQIGYVMGVDALPESWLAMIEGRPIPGAAR